jgi:hypothetical protein
MGNLTWFAFMFNGFNVRIKADIALTANHQLACRYGYSKKISDRLEMDGFAEMEAQKISTARPVMDS